MSASEIMQDRATPAMGRGLTFAMALACGAAAANIYYNQPMLGVIEREFAGSPTVGMIPTATQLGYAAGLLFLVPLGDLMDRRRLIVVQFAVLALALVAAAVAPTPAILVAASALVGITSTVAQQIVPFAASLATPERRGSVIGTVMGGLFCGILLSRTIAGFVATHAGWREMFLIAVPVSLAFAALMAVTLPRSAPHARIAYHRAMVSLAHLWRDEPVLRQAAIKQAALFAAFSVFWTILALHLQEPAYNLGADVAGLFGVLGTVGVFAAPISGRLADRYGARVVVLCGALLALAAWIVFGSWGSVLGMVVGVVLLDLGVQGSLISNQHTVYALRPEARSRLNTIFMTAMFLGGSAGSAGATLAWNTAGWPAVVAYGIALAALAVVIDLIGWRQAGPAAGGRAP
ncbi:MAG: MFS transporter [Alphaproteobacteria bacterium]|jgi:predicted MFS family arabinose efflux permease|nr:MFS transporter [Alphaproteobacteria bacterium]